jgi:hypothetical protein
MPDRKGHLGSWGCPFYSLKTFQFSDENGNPGLVEITGFLAKPEEK